MNAYINGTGPQPNWYNYFTVGQTQAFESGSNSVSSSSQNSTPNKVSAALNTQESQNDKVISDEITGNIGSNTDSAQAAAIKQAQQAQQPQQPQQAQVLSDFGNASKPISETTTILIPAAIPKPPIPLAVAPGIETPQSKGLDLGQSALSGNETKTPILGSGSTVTPISTGVQIAKTVINTPAPASAPSSEINFVSTNPSLRNAILQEWQSNPKSFQYYPSNYLQNLVAKGVLSNDDLSNTIKPSIVSVKSTPTVSTPIITTTKTAVPSTTVFVSSNPGLRNAIIQERENNPNAFKTLPSNYLQSLIKTGVLSNEDVYNTVQPTVYFQVSNSKPSKALSLNAEKPTLGEVLPGGTAGPKSTNPELESELVSNITAHPEKYGNYTGYLTSLETKNVLLPSDIDKINAAFLNYNKQQETKLNNFNNGISTNPELEQAIIEARTSNPSAFVNINPSYLIPLENKGVITKPDVTILNNSVKQYNAQVQKANAPFVSTNEGLREAILKEYATNPAMRVSNAGNYLMGLEKQGILSFDDILTLQPWVVTPKTPLPKTGAPDSAIGEFVKNSNIGINETLADLKGVYNFIASGGKDNNIPSSDDIISQAISAPIQSYQESKSYGVSYGTVLASKYQQIGTSISANPAGAIGRALPTIWLSLLPVGDIVSGAKTGISFLKGLVTGNSEEATAKSIIGNVLQTTEVTKSSSLAAVKNSEALQASIKSETGKAPLPYVGVDIAQTTTKTAAPYVVEKTATPGIYRFYVGSGNDEVATGKQLIEESPVVDYSKGNLVKPKGPAVAPSPKPSYVAAGVLDLNKGTVELYTPETTITKQIPNKILGTGTTEPKDLQLMRAAKINNNAFEVTTKTNPSEVVNSVPSDFVNANNEQITKSLQSELAKAKQIGPINTKSELFNAKSLNKDVFATSSTSSGITKLPESTYIHPTTLTRINEAIESGNAKVTGTGYQFSLSEFKRSASEFGNFIINGPGSKVKIPEPSAISKIISVQRFGAGAARGVTYGGTSVGGKTFDNYLKSLGLNPGYEERAYSFEETTKASSGTTKAPGSPATPGNPTGGESATKTLQEQVKEITTPASKVKPTLEISKPITGTIPVVEPAKQETTTTKTTTSPGVRNLYKGISRLVKIKNSTPTDMIEQDSNLKRISKSNTKMINDLAHLPGTDLIAIPDLEESTKKKTGPVVDLVPLGKMEDLTKLGTLSKLNKKQSDMPGLDVTPKNIPGLKKVPKLDLPPGVDLTTIPKVGLTPGTKLEQVPAFKIPPPPPDLIPVPTIPENPTSGDIIQPFKFKKLGDFGYREEGSSKKGSKVHVFYDVEHLGNVVYTAEELQRNPFGRRSNPGKKSKSRRSERS